MRVRPVRAAVGPTADLTMEMIPNRLRYRWLRLSPGARWPAGPPGRDLLRRLNNTARACRSKITITSGRRGVYAQHLAYNDYLRGGPLAAPCGWKNWVHSWAECPRDCRSNHCRSRAADCLIEGPGGSHVNIGELEIARAKMRSHGLCLPVGQGETWHVEVGSVWRS